MYYRGIKQTPENTAKEKKSRVAGIYRGIKHDAIKSDKSASCLLYTSPSPRD